MSRRHKRLRPEQVRAGHTVYLVVPNLNRFPMTYHVETIRVMGKSTPWIGPGFIWRDVPVDQLRDAMRRHPQDVITRSRRQADTLARKLNLRHRRPF